MSLLLSVAVLTGLALAAARPWLAGHRRDLALAVLLDTSPSMGQPVEPGGEGRRIDLARDAALALLRGAAATPFRVLVLAGSDERAVVARAGEDAELERSLRGLQVSSGPASLERLAASAAEVVRSRGGGRVVVISDFCGSPLRPADDTPGVRLEAVHAGEGCPAVATAGVAGGSPARFSIAVANGPVPPVLAACLEALRGTGRIATTGIPVELFLGRPPSVAPPRWIFLASDRGRSDARALPPVALDLLEPAPGFFDPVTPWIFEASQLPPLPPPSRARAMALAAGHPAVAVVETPGSRGIWWGVPIDAAPERRRFLPLVVEGMLEWLAEADARAVPPRSTTIESSARPVRPPGSKGAGLAVRDAGRAPVPLRVPLTLGVLGLVAVEGTRRLLAAEATT